MSTPSPGTHRPAPTTNSAPGLQPAICSALNSQYGATSTTLARAAGLGRSTTIKALRALEQTGLARHEIPAAEEPGRPTHNWYVTPPDKAETNGRRGSGGRW